MNKFNALILGIIILGSSACNVQPTLPATTTPPTASASPTQPKTGVIRFAASTPSISSVPFLMALDTLREQGYTIETTTLRFDLVIPVLTKGDLDIAPLSHQLGWSAIAKDAPLRTIVSWVGNQFLIVVKPEIQSCANLQGKPMGYGSTTAVNTALFEEYLKRTCTGIAPQAVLIPSSTNRVAALLAGQLDGALLETDDWLQIERQAPGKFRILRRLAEEFPKVEIGGYGVRNDFAAAHPEKVKDFVRALLQAYRRVQDKPVFQDQVAKYLPGDGNALAAVDVYLAQKVFDVNGGLTSESVQATLDFLTLAKAIPAGLIPTQVVDGSYLRAVLDEIGRK